MITNTNLISVIINTFGRCADLKDTLESLAIQKTNGLFKYEVIIVNNNPTDPCTPALVAAYMPRFRGRLRYRVERRKGKSFALNSSLKIAQGEIVAFTDDDVICDRDWLLNLWDCYARFKCDAVGGRVLPLYPPDTPRWVLKFQRALAGPIVCYNDYWDAVKPYDRMVPFIGANMSIRMSCFRRYGYFRTDLGAGTGALGEDADMFNRLQNAGLKLYYCGKSFVYHKAVRSRMNMKYVAQWSMEFGRAIVRRYDRKPGILYFGFPRWVLKSLVVKSTFMMANMFNPEGFITWFKGVCSDIGVLQEYRRGVDRQPIPME